MPVKPGHDTDSLSGKFRLSELNQDIRICAVEVHEPCIDRRIGQLRLDSATNITDALPQRQCLSR
jgi:hypothetical protein